MKRKKSGNFGFLIGEGFRSTFKHGFMSFAAVCITVACLVIITSFGLISYNMNLMVEEAQEQMRILVVIDEDYTEAQSKSVGSTLNLVDNVKDAQFISRAEALERFAERVGEGTLEGIDPSTMRDQYEITMEDNALVEETVTALKNVAGVVEVVADADTANSLATIRNVLYIGSLAIAGVLLIVSLIIISNTIRLAMLDRKQEIAIMKMVGATNGFIRLPFFVEGFLLGLIGALVSFFLEWGLYEVVRNAIIGTGHLDILIVVPFTQMLLPVAILCGVAGLIIGIFGSLMSIRRFLKV